jgi:hypothetical protein
MGSLAGKDDYKKYKNENRLPAGRNKKVSDTFIPVK